MSAMEGMFEEVAPEHVVRKQRIRELLRIMNPKNSYVYLINSLKPFETNTALQAIFSMLVDEHEVKTRKAALCRVATPRHNSILHIPR